MRLRNRLKPHLWYWNGAWHVTQAPTSKLLPVFQYMVGQRNQDAWNWTKGVRPLSAEMILRARRILEGRS